MVQDMKKFKKEALKITGTSFAVSTLPLAPSISKLDGDSYRLAKPNLTQQLIALNDDIMSLNVEPGQTMPTYSAPRYHTWGLRSTRTPKSIGPRNLLESMPAHAHEDWREKCPKNQLHLSDEVRLRMGRAAIKYFKSIYGIKH